MAVLQTVQEVESLEQQIFGTLVPAQTDSYSPVSHQNIVETIQEKCDQHGLEIRNKQYWMNKQGQQVTGKFNIGVEGDDELGMMVAFRNSYDKSMSLGFAAGGNVWICTNGMIGGDITLVRRHTGSIVTEINDKITTSLNSLDAEFLKLIRQKDAMKNIGIDRTESAELVGRMFIEENLINSTQLNIIKREMFESEAFREPTLWSTYNHITEAYKKSSAYSFIDNHVELHDFIETEFELVS